MRRRRRRPEEDEDEEMQRGAAAAAFSLLLLSSPSPDEEEEVDRDPLLLPASASPAAEGEKQASSPLLQLLHPSRSHYCSCIRSCCSRSKREPRSGAWRGVEERERKKKVKKSRGVFFVVVTFFPHQLFFLKSLRRLSVKARELLPQPVPHLVPVAVIDPF